MSRIDSKLNIILVLAAMLVIFVLCLSSCGGNNDTDPASSTPSQISTGQSASQTQKTSGVAGTSAQSRDDKGSGDNDSQSNAQDPDSIAEKHEAGSDNSGNGGYDKNDSPAGEKAVSAPKSNKNSGAQKNDKSEAESSRTSKNDKKSSDSDGAQNIEISGNDSRTSQNDDRQGSEPDVARPTEKTPDIPENTRERDNAEVNFNDL